MTACATASLTSANETALPDSVIISRDVTVEAGDTLAGIAQRELGRGGLAFELANFNNIALNDILRPGQIIRIPVNVPSRNESAEVVFVKGDVSVTRQPRAGSSPSANVVATAATDTLTDAVDTTQPQSFQLERNAEVFIGDVITTSASGFVSIAFSSGSVINLQPDTIATLERLVCLETDDSCIVEIITQRGRITSEVEARGQQPVEFRITTPQASAAVRGTVFDIDVADQLLVALIEGDLDVAAQNQTVALTEGFGLTVQQGEPPGEPIELLPAPVFKRVPARIATGDTVEWWPFGDAEAYQLLLSNDEAGLDTLNTLQLPAVPSQVDLQPAIPEPLDSGDYFLTLRAVDNNGLQGFTSVTRITLADIDEAIPTVSTEVTREGGEFVVSVLDLSEDALGYEMQISTDESFSDPLSVDVNQTGIAVFRVDDDRVFTRARVLVNPVTVSAFGPISSN